MGICAAAFVICVVPPSEPGKRLFAIIWLVVALNLAALVGARL